MERNKLIRVSKDFDDLFREMQAEMAKQGQIVSLIKVTKVIERETRKKKNEINWHL